MAGEEYPFERRWGKGAAHVLPVRGGKGRKGKKIKEIRKRRRGGKNIPKIETKKGFHLYLEMESKYRLHLETKQKFRL